MMLRITNAIRNVANKRLTEIFESGAFPKVEWAQGKRDGSNLSCTSFVLHEYQQVWRSFVQVIHARMQTTLDPTLGVFTRKHSASFLADVTVLCNGIGEFEIMNEQAKIATSR